MAYNANGAANLLNGFINGNRAGIADNWTDLNQYTNVYKKMQDNAYNDAIFQPVVSMVNDDASSSRQNLWRQTVNNGLYAMRIPAFIDDINALNAMSPYLSAMRYGTMFGQGVLTSHLLGGAMANPSFLNMALFGGMPGGAGMTLPSIIG